MRHANFCREDRGQTFIIVALMLFARRAYLPPALALPYVRGAR